jgi:hypothetical protein
MTSLDLNSRVLSPPSPSLQVSIATRVRDELQELLRRGALKCFANQKVRPTSKLLAESLACLPASRRGTALPAFERRITPLPSVFMA